MKHKRPKPLCSEIGRAYAELKRARGGAFQLHLGPMREPSHLFHFSSAAGIEAILQSGTLWASDVRLMRDQTEFAYAVELLRSAVKRPDHYFEEVSRNLAEEVRGQCLHVACLSLEACLGSQWLNYADSGRGCAISFDFQEIRKFGHGIGSFPLAYDPGVQIQMIESYLRRAHEIVLRHQPPKVFHDQVLRDVAALLFSIKNPTHAPENEWRLQVNHTDPWKLRKRPDGGCCSELPICTPRTVCGLLLGPGCPLTVEEAEDLLKRGGYNTAAAFKLSTHDLR